jgi:hypothetical protein
LVPVPPEVQQQPVLLLLLDLNPCSDQLHPPAEDTAAPFPHLKLVVQVVQVVEVVIV